MLEYNLENAVEFRDHVFDLIRVLLVLLALVAVLITSGI